jgi:hypothetical protein
MPPIAGERDRDRLRARRGCLRGRFRPGRPLSGEGAGTTSRIDETNMPAPDPAVYTVELDGEAVLLDQDTGGLHLLNSTGTLVWLCLDGQSTLAEIAADIADGLRADPSRVRDDVLALARQFADEGLLTGSQAVESPERSGDGEERLSPYVDEPPDP